MGRIEPVEGERKMALRSPEVTTGSRLESDLEFGDGEDAVPN